MMNGTRQPQALICLPGQERLLEHERDEDTRTAGRR